MQHRDKARTRIYWQYKNSPKLIAWLLALPDIAQAQLEDQLAKIKAILDIDNAEGEQLDICGRIVGYHKRPVGTFYPACAPAKVSDMLFRRMIKAKIHKNNSAATIDEITAATNYILDTEARLLDGQDMTMRPIFYDYLDPGSQQLVRDYDLIPRPQGVGIRSPRILTYTPFGFGKYYSNFRVPFWHGDGIHFYSNLQLALVYDSANRKISGALTANRGVTVSSVDVILFYTSNGTTVTQTAVTDTAGRFFVTVPVAAPFYAVARAQVWTPLCQWENVEGKMDANIFYNGSVKYDGTHTYRG